MSTVTEVTRKSKGSHSLGRLEDYKTTSIGLVGQTSFGQFKIDVYNANVIRIGITLEENFDDFSYAVIAQPDQVTFGFNESKQYLELTTKDLTLQIAKDPVRFRFLDAKGNVINEDDHAFGTSWIGDEITTYKKLKKDERFIGLGEKTGNLDRRGSGYTNWNTDSFAYGPDGDPLYCSMPFYIGLHGQQAYGIYLDNSYKSHFNFGASNDRFSSFTVEGGDMNYYFIHHDNLADIISSYTHLTGRMSLPPLWSLGYQQCRYSYYPDKEVLNVARTFREKNIPADVIVLDIHYMDAYKIFSWDPENFPDPKAMMDQLRELGFEVVVMCDPGIKVEEGYEPYDDGCDQDVFVKYPDGTNYTGKVWPGWCHFPDFTNPKTRQWWGEKFADYAALGVEGYWNDMNEIATWGQRLPDLLEFDFEGEKTTSKQGRNVYGMQMARSTFDGAKKQLEGKRPFILTRSGFSGVQRYSAVWTGDNVSNDEHMLLGVRIVNSLGLTGVAFTGYDVGGFVGESSGNLFARWISIGALSPFFRGHTMINSSDAEPWAYGEEVEEISRHYINLRYRLLPYIYSLFYEASQTGMPVSRSLAIDHPFDENIFDPRFQNQYLFGPNILVAPTESYRDLTKVYLPEGEWYDFHTGQKYQGLQTIVAESPLNQLPIFIRSGGFLPMQSVVQSVASPADPTLQLHLYAGTETSTFQYYEDDGSTYDYQQGGSYKRQLQFDPAHKQIILGSVKGATDSKFSEAKVFLHGFEKLSQVKVNSDLASVMAESVMFIPPVSNFDPIDNEVKVEGLSVQTFVFALKNDEIVIQY